MVEIFLFYISDLPKDNELKKVFSQLFGYDDMYMFPVVFFDLPIGEIKGFLIKERDDKLKVIREAKQDTKIYNKAIKQAAKKALIKSALSKLTKEEAAAILSK